MHHMAPFFFRVGEITNSTLNVVVVVVVGFFFTIQDTTVHYYVLPSFPFFLHTAGLGGVMRGIFPSHAVLEKIWKHHWKFITLVHFCSHSSSEIVTGNSAILCTFSMKFSQNGNGHIFCSVGEILKLYCFPSCIVKK